MTSKEKRRKGRRSKHEHKRCSVFIERELLSKFLEKFPNVNISYFIEICMKMALESVGEEYLLEEDEILLGKIKAGLRKIESILSHEKFKSMIDFDKAIKIAEKESDLRVRVKDIID